MTKQEFTEWAQTRGWSMDRWGHLRKGDFRFKLGALSVRLEHAIKWEDYISKSDLGDGERFPYRWTLQKSAYYGKLSIVGGKVSGFTVQPLGFAPKGERTQS